MTRETFLRALGVLALILLAAIVVFAQKDRTAIATLTDFTEVEVRGVGFVLDRDLTVTVEAVGGGDRSFLRQLVDDEHWSGMYAYGWIIDAATREAVWVMDQGNTYGRRDERKAEEKLSLKKGAYEVYFSAHGYIRSGAFSYSSANIDRRSETRRGRNFVSIFGDDYDDLYKDFMENAKDRWGITLFVDTKDAGSVKPFAAPAPFRQSLLAVTGVGDNAVVRKTITTKKAVTVRVYALGEGQGRDELFDHGWIVNADTRRRVWDMSRRSFGRAGGAQKNILADTDVTLDPGTYELVYVTDDSHSPDDWNDRPPYDPLSYGVTLFLTNEADRASIAVSDGSPRPKKLLVDVTGVRDDEYRSVPFSLSKEVRVRVLALGERSGSRRMADYGWIVDAKSRRKVWTMEESHTEHAGGAAKNRMVDEIITLPKGSYIVYYQTDDSHAFGDWNSSPPLEPDRWGISLWAIDDAFDPSVLKIGEDVVTTDVIAQIVRVRNSRHDRKSFALTKRENIRITALGEGSDGTMYDYGWIENATTGRTIWEMTYRMTERAGGATKNRLAVVTVALEPGEYVLHYRTDDSHAFNDWNADPPPDRESWGISLTREE